MALFPMSKGGAGAKTLLNQVMRYRIMDAISATSALVCENYDSIEMDFTGYGWSGYRMTVYKKDLTTVLTTFNVTSNTFKKTVDISNEDVIYVIANGNGRMDFQFLS